MTFNAVRISFTSIKWHFLQWEMPHN